MSAPTLDYPPAPSPSHLSEKLLEVDNTPSNDHTPQSSGSNHYGPPKSLGFAAFLPFAAVVLWAFGLGSSLLIWLLVKKPDGLDTSSPIFNGYFVVDEGNKTSNDRMPDGQVILESTMRGVLLINIISNTSAIIVTPLMALGAFHVAAKWLDDQALSKEGPTPFQFGLVMQMCSSVNLKSVFMTLVYLFKRRKSNPPSSRSRVSPMVYRALSIAGMIVILHYTVIITNIVLTADIGTTYYPKVVKIRGEPVFSNLGSQYNPNNGYWERVDEYLQGAEGVDLPGLWKSFSLEAQATTIGNSTKNHIAMIDISTSSSFQDTEYMAVIIRPPSSASLKLFWTAPTVGMKIQCQPIQCTYPDEDTAAGMILICPEGTSAIPYHTIQHPTFPYMDYVTNPDMRRTSYVQTYSSSNGAGITNSVTTRNPQLQPPQLSNPSTFFAKLLIPSDNTWSDMRDKTEIGSIRLDSMAFVFYLGACEATMHHVQVSFNASAYRPEITNRNAGNSGLNHQYSLASTPVPMTPEETTQVFLPMFMNVVNDTNPLVSEYVIQSPFSLQISRSAAVALLRDITEPGFSTKVSFELARQALAYVAGMNVTTVPATNVTDILPTLVTRYPLPETIAFVGAVYLNGLFAIILFAGIVRKSSKTVETDGTFPKNWNGVEVEKTQEPAQELQLVHLRLTDPLAIVAEHFLQPDTQKEGEDISRPNKPGRALSTQAGVADMFDEESPNTTRVDIGLIDRSDGERWYGLRHRKNDVLVTGTGKEA